MCADARWGPIGKNVCYANYTHIMVSLLGHRGRDNLRRCCLLSLREGLEGDRGRDRVRRCCLLTSLREGLEGDRSSDRVQWCRLFSRHSKRRSTLEIVLSRIFQNFASKMANCIISIILCYY